MAGLNRMAHRLVQEATEPREEPSQAQRNGQKGGKARAAKLSTAKRRAIAKKGAAKRWA